MPIDELNELEAKLNELVAMRNRGIDHALDQINKANRAFDEAALPIGRRIAELKQEREALVPKAPRKRKSTTKTFNTDGMEGWTDEEIAHFHELRSKR